MSDTITIKVYDGKYTFRWTPAEGIRVDRYDTREWWIVTQGSNAVLALMQHAENQKSALDAANEALRLERAETARLRDVIQHVVASMGHSGSEAPESLPCNESCIGCDDDSIGCDDDHRRDLPADRCTDHPDAESDSECWRCLLLAALSPRPGAKESADE